MPKISANSSKTTNSDKEFLKTYNKFPCKICKRPHPLRTCRQFLDMNMKDRLQTVRKYGYCGNCLAHNHSKGTCISKSGCKHCHRFHHTLLHVNPRLVKDLLSTTSRSRSPSPPRSSPPKRERKPSPKTTPKEATTSKSSLTAILRQNTLVLLHTVLVKISSFTSHARCLLESGSTISRVSKGLVEKLDLTSFSLHDETVCPIVLKSRFDTSNKIEGIFRVDNRISLRTPSKSLPETYKKHFPDIFLADSKFYESAPIDSDWGRYISKNHSRRGPY